MSDLKKYLLHLTTIKDCLGEKDPSLSEVTPLKSMLANPISCFIICRKSGRNLKWTMTCH